MVTRTYQTSMKRTPMQPSWLSLLPPIIVLISAFITKKLNPSLLIGLIAATFIASKYSLPDTLRLTADRLMTQITDVDYLYLYGFLLLIGVIILLLGSTGGASSFARTVEGKIKNRKGVESLSLCLSSLLFIDDYLSSLTVGYIVRPLSDKFKIPRVKLAYLIHSLSGPLVILAPISSWVAMIISQLNSSGIGLDTAEGSKIIADPFFVYLHSIPFIFYSFLTIMSIWFIVRKRISFGPMHEHEMIAEHKNNLFGGKEIINQRLATNNHKQGKLIDLILPLGILIGSIFLGIAYMGGYWLFGGSNTLLEAFKNNSDTFLVLFSSAVITLVFSLIFSLLRKTISISEVPTIIKDGILLMYPAVLMVFLASALGTVLREDLFVGQYLANLLQGFLSTSMLPCVLFIVATIVATITGSSWGTIALLLPIAIQMILALMHAQTPLLPHDIGILYPALGAIFSGAVCGDHISPVSETTIMAATSSGSDPLDHSYTQFFYMIPVIISTAIAFAISGYMSSYSTTANVVTSLGVATIVCLGMIYILHIMQKAKNKKLA